MVVVHEAVVSAAHAAAEIQARPHAPATAANATAGTAPAGDLVLAGVQVHVPASYRADKLAGVLVMLHGAGANPKQPLALLKGYAASANLLIVAPKSDAATWDVIAGGFGPDVAAIDRVLTAVFDQYAVDPARVAIGGFSDGASYALTLGLANGALFRAILAFSPGFERAPRHQERPRIFISHGTGDRVLPIGRTSHRLVPALQRASYRVEYFEFSGPHTVPPEAVRKALALLSDG
jgi:phospholipase/carboxylesterase